MSQPAPVGGNIDPGPGWFDITDDQGRYSLELVLTTKEQPRTLAVGT